MTVNMQMLIAIALSLFGICFTTADVVMGPKSKYNTSTLIREVNSSLDLSCRSNISSSLLITHCVDGGKICSNITTEKGQESEVVVRFLSLKSSDSGTYICRELSDPTEPWTTTILKVGVKPDLPETVDCVSPDLAELSCNWKKTEAQMNNRVPTRWEIQYKWRTSTNQSWFSRPEKPCREEKITEALIQCSWTVEGDFAHGREFQVYLTGKNQLGNVTKTYDVNPENYAKLSIKKLQLEPSATSLKFTLYLNGDLYLSTTESIVFETSVENLRSKQEITNVWERKTNEYYEGTIQELQPYTSYSLCIKARIYKDRGFWSESACEMTETEESAPTHAPETNRWAYSIEKGSIKLYLKDVPPSHRTSKNYSYSFTQGQGGVPITNCASVSPNTVRIGIPASRFTGGEPLFIRTCNDLGCSNDSTQVNVDKARTEVRPRGVVVTKNTDNALYTVSWEENEVPRMDIQHTIFYYCRGFRETDICQSDFGWETKSGAPTNLTIKVPSADNGDWMFGVAIVAKDNTSGGILFASSVRTSQSHSEDFPEEVLIVMLVILTITLISMAFFLLRCLKQCYCEEIKIELPEILRRNNQRDASHDPNSVPYRYANPDKGHPVSVDGCRGSNDTRREDRVNSCNIPSDSFAQQGSVFVNEVRDNTGESFEFLPKLKQQSLLSNGYPDIHPVISDWTTSDNDNKNDDDCTHSVTVTNVANLVNTNEIYVTNEEYIEQKQGKEEMLKEEENLLPQGYSRCTNVGDFSNFFKQSQNSIAYLQYRNCNNGVIDQLDLDSVSWSTRSSSANIEHAPFLLNPSQEFKESVNMHQEYVL